MAMSCFHSKFEVRQKRLNRWENGEERNRSPKGNMWSAVPVALLYMIVNWSERKQGSGPEGEEVL